MDGNRLADLIEQAGYRAQSYSGRGMYGDVCLGVVVSSLRDAMLLGMKLGKVATELEQRKLSGLTVRQDNMGRDMILYYPGVAWPKDRKEAVDDESEDYTDGD